MHETTQAKRRHRLREAEALYQYQMVGSKGNSRGQNADKTDRRQKWEDEKWGGRVSGPWQVTGEGVDKSKDMSDMSSTVDTDEAGLRILNTATKANGSYANSNTAITIDQDDTIGALGDFSLALRPNSRLELWKAYSKRQSDTSLEEQQEVMQSIRDGLLSDDIQVEDLTDEQLILYMDSEVERQKNRMWVTTG